MTHKYLTDVATKWLKRHKQNTIVPNCSTVATELVTNTTTGEIPDVIGWCSWTSVLIEAKTSRTDYFRDFKKSFRKYPNMGMGEFRYYICKYDLIKTTDLPQNWGLLYCSEKGEIKIVKKAKEQESNLRCERTMLLSLIRRKNK